MGSSLAIRRDLAEPDELRRLARRERDRRTATRMLAIANALEGMTRAEAARLAGLERQALRDAVLRFNAEGLDGLRDRPRSGRPPALSEGEQAVLRATVFRKPRGDEGGGEWTLPRLCAWIEHRFSLTHREACPSKPSCTRPSRRLLTLRRREGHEALVAARGKTHLQPPLTAAATNLGRLADWPADTAVAQTRRSAFVRLVAAPA